MVDVIAWRAYSAEHSLPPQAPLHDFSAVERFVDHVVTSSLWQELVQFPHKITVTEAPYEAHESWLERNRPFEYTTATLAVHPEMRWTLNLLHELAHGASPRYRYRPAQPGKEWPAHQEIHPHGEKWASTYLRLVREFAPDWHPQLREAYKHYRVALVDDDTLAKAIAESRRAEHELTQWDATAEGDLRTWGHMAIRLQQESPTRTLQRSFSQVLVGGAFRFGAPGRSEKRLFDPVAAAVNAVVACTPKDLERLSRHDTLADLRDAEPPHEAERLARVAMAALVVLDVDPIVMRTDLGLTRWTVGLEEDQVARLNPGWWERVQQLNALMNARPSRWEPITLGGTDVDTADRTTGKIAVERPQTGPGRVPSGPATLDFMSENALDCPIESCGRGEIAWAAVEGRNGVVFNAGSCDNCGTIAGECFSCGEVTGDVAGGDVKCDGCAARYATSMAPGDIESPSDVTWWIPESAH